MTAPVFLDTNVLIFAMDRGDLRKHEAARFGGQSRGRGTISFQVLQEFYVNVAQKWPGASARARAEVARFCSTCMTNSGLY